MWCFLTELNFTLFSYLENVYNQHTVGQIKSENVPNVVAENPLDKLDCKLRI